MRFRSHVNLRIHSCVTLWFEPVCMPNVTVKLPHQTWRANMDAAMKPPGLLQGKFIFKKIETNHSCRLFTWNCNCDYYLRSSQFTLNDVCSLKHINTRFPLLLFLCTEQFNDTNLFTFLQDRATLLLTMQNVHSRYCLLLRLFSSLCPHTVFWCS